MRNASESELREFLDDPPQNYNNPDTAAATSGYCKYRSPAPYGSEYTGYNHPTCFAAVLQHPRLQPADTELRPVREMGRVGGELLAAEQRPVRADGPQDRHGAGAGRRRKHCGRARLARPRRTRRRAVGNGLASRWAFHTRRSHKSREPSGRRELATVAAIMIVAFVIAVMQGIIVVNAAELPGQLAELIVDARTNAPDVTADEMGVSVGPAHRGCFTDGMTTLFALFVAATLPEPRDEYCDNSSTVPDNIKHGGFLVDLSWRPCLNATAIPAATPYDPQFLIKEDGETTGTLSPTITFQDHAETTTTARLHDGWFILEPTGSYDEQTLAIEYVDWDGKKQQAWLLGNPVDGQVFVSLDVTDDLTDGLEDCLDDGLCSESESLQYLSPDGKKLSASVEQWKPAVGAPSYDATPDELSPTSYDANGFAPTDATGEVSYQWRFEEGPCTKPCVLLEEPLAPPGIRRPGRRRRR